MSPKSDINDGPTPIGLQSGLSSSLGSVRLSSGLRCRWPPDSGHSRLGQQRTHCAVIASSRPTINKPLFQLFVCLPLKQRFSPIGSDANRCHSVPVCPTLATHWATLVWTLDCTHVVVSDVFSINLQHCLNVKILTGLVNNVARWKWHARSCSKTCTLFTPTLKNTKRNNSLSQSISFAQTLNQVMQLCSEGMVASGDFPVIYYTKIHTYSSVQINCFNWHKTASTMSASYHGICWVWTTDWDIGCQLVHCSPLVWEFDERNKSIDISAFEDDIAF